MKRYAFLTSVLGGSDQTHAMAAHLQDNGPRYPGIGGWLAPRAGLDALQNKDLPPPPPTPTFVCQPARSQTTHIRPSTL